MDRFTREDATTLGNTSDAMLFADGVDVADAAIAMVVYYNINTSHINTSLLFLFIISYV